MQLPDIKRQNQEGLDRAENYRHASTCIMNALSALRAPISKPNPEHYNDKNNYRWAAAEHNHRLTELENIEEQLDAIADRYQALRK